ncbi:ABC transporter ATP-binding protein [Methanocella sp. CWC-04]|uniref:ABC transporter ATP-binding protein n=1 Tax=Methanooceanicella nereidis TaxID=2052831 RepID=A0AAP2W7Y4_9EURY|nr:ABC transporter ATP-binding protein [Methanocella sp. CWC-04]MCD1295541.1 ABC transporter ATP-binding protein [Methanocella sp. CWC-04]
MDNNDLVISTNGLTKAYNGVQALKSLDLKVRKNSIFGFLGPNGAGKSTTIKLLLGLIKPTAGSGNVFGMDIVKESTLIRKRIGYLAQDPRYYDYMSARETLRFTARFFYSGPKNEIENKIDDTLELVGLDDKADRPIKGFSGGERQRLGIAQAQINDPDLLILDEPAASLDPMGRRDVLEIMEKLREKTTIFYSTHILSDVQRVSDTVAILNRGELVAQAPIEELLQGNGNAVYSLVLKGDAANARSVLTGQPWVSLVNTVSSNGSTSINVTVTDDSIAEDRLLRLVLEDKSVQVKEFGKKRYELEEIFMNIVGGKNNV